MATELATRANGAAPDAAVMEKVIATGDLEALTPAQRVHYYRSVCESVGLNWLTQPFEYIKLNGKLRLYARKDATDQLRDLKGVNINITARERVEDVYVVTARATLPSGRTDESIGAVPIGTLKGEALANALMKAETKAKRRVTLSAVGLGWLDESEISSIPNVPPVNVDHATGEILDAAPIAHALAPQMAARQIEGVKDNADPQPVVVEAEVVNPPAPSLDLKATLTWIQTLPPAEAWNRKQREAMKRLCDERLPAEAERFGLVLPERTADMDPAAWATQAVMTLAERDDDQPF